MLGNTSLLHISVVFKIIFLNIRLVYEHTVRENHLFKIFINFKCITKTNLDIYNINTYTEVKL